MRAHCTLPPQGAAAEAALAQCASVPVLETARLRLRAPRVTDLPAWTALFSGADAAFIGGPFEDPDCRAWEEFAYYTGCWMLYGHGLWSVERRDMGALIGFVHLGLEWEDREPELGWHLIETARGQGYGAEMAQAARAYGLGLLDGFVSYVHPENGPSNRLAQRIGARRDHAAETEILATDGAPCNVWRHGKGAE